MTSVGRLRHLLPHAHTNEDAGRNNQRGESSSRHHRVQKLYFRSSCLPGPVESSHFLHAGPFDRIPIDPCSLVRSVKPIVAVSNEGNIRPLMPFRSAHQAAAALVIASPQLFWLKFNSLVQHIASSPCWWPHASKVWEVQTGCTARVCPGTVWKLLQSHWCVCR